MAIPKVGSGVGSAGQIAKAALERNKKTTDPSKSFDKVLNKGGQQAKGVNVSKANLAQQAQALDKTQLKPNLDIQKHGVPSALKGFLSNYTKNSKSLDKLVNKMSKGQKLSSPELLKMQALSYKVTFEIDTISKFAEVASGAIKQTMQTQV